MEDITRIQELSEQVKEIINNFLNSQLGEKASKIDSFLNNEIIAVYAHDILSPAEKQMVESDLEKKMLMEYKVQQFKSVKQEIVSELSQKTGLIIKDAHTVITKDGIRIINITIDSHN